MNNKQMKLENPARLQELNPTDTLIKIGLLEDHVLCDIGAGSGIFTIPASKITKNKVYALEISDEMLAVIKEKADRAASTNIELVKVKGDCLELLDHSVDIVLLVTVLHEIRNPIIFLEEAKRILKADGKIAVIEFHKFETPMGPPVDHRMGKDDVSDLLKSLGFLNCAEFDLGNNLYCLTFQVEKA